MKLRSCAILLLSAAALHAQASIPPMMSTNFRGQSDPQGNWWGTLTVTGPLPIRPALLEAPFSGQETRKREQLLADGTRITQPGGSEAKVARDALGRTRIERSLIQMMSIPGRPAQQPLTIVEINDPVEGSYYILDPAKKIAYRVKYRPVLARTIPAKRPATPPPGVQIKGALIPGGNPSAPEVTVEQLGSKFMQGVEVEGRRQTMVYPVGSRGNDRPMTEVNETWMAPSLQVTMLQTTKSPMGDSSFELTNFSAVNPTPDLFRVPAGYEVKDQPVTFTVEFGNCPAGVQR